MLTLLLCTALASAAPAPVDAIDTVLADFTHGAATRDVQRVAASLHAESRQYVTMDGKVQVIDTPAYLGLLEAGKVGGTPTTRTVHGIALGSGQATVQQTRTAGRFTFHDAVTLVQEGTDWRIVSIAVQVEAAP